MSSSETTKVVQKFLTKSSPSSIHSNSIQKSNSPGDTNTSPKTKPVSPNAPLPKSRLSNSSKIKYQPSSMLCRH
jgi:hypothetical protein